MRAWAMLLMSSEVQAKWTNSAPGPKPMAASFSLRKYSTALTSWLMRPLDLLDPGHLVGPEVGHPPFEDGGRLSAGAAPVRGSPARPPGPATTPPLRRSAAGTRPPRRSCGRRLDLAGVAAVEGGKGVGGVHAFMRFVRSCVSYAFRAFMRFVRYRAFMRSCVRAFVRFVPGTSRYRVTSCGLRSGTRLHRLHRGKGQTGSRLRTRSETASRPLTGRNRSLASRRRWSSSSVSSRSAAAALDSS